MAKQPHLREAGSLDLEGLVCISRTRIAESRSWIVLDAPCMDEPPATLIRVFGAGDAVRDEFLECDRVRTFGKSEVRKPDAEGGSLEEAAGIGAGTGSWRASGFSERANVLASGASLRPLRAPAI